MQAPRVRIERLGGRGIDQGNGSEIRDRLTRPASALDQSCVSAEARAAYIAAPARPRISSKPSSRMESLALIDHCRIVRAGLYKGFGAASEIEDCNAPALIAGGSRGIG
jgi:hypothetical protein